MLERTSPLTCAWMSSAEMLGSFAFAGAAVFLVVMKDPIFLLTRSS